MQKITPFVWFEAGEGSREILRQGVRQALEVKGCLRQCGWLKDRYGVSLQVVPMALGKLMSGHDPLRAGRVTQAMLKMGKLDRVKLKAA
jgi:predicted 3-demethylubiquinone-9 3-methyltransferase (glyoxalase superfamily)